MDNKHHDLATKVQALTLLTSGMPVLAIEAITSISRSQIFRIRQKALTAGYNPAISPAILLIYVEDAPKSGRPSKVTPEKVRELIEHISTCLLRHARATYSRASFARCSGYSASITAANSHYVIKKR